MKKQLLYTTIGFPIATVLAIVFGRMLYFLFYYTTMFLGIANDFSNAASTVLAVALTIIITMITFVMIAERGNDSSQDHYHDL